MLMNVGHFYCIWFISIKITNPSVCLSAVFSPGRAIRSNDAQWSPGLLPENT